LFKSSKAWFYGQYGRWVFAEFTEVYQIESDFKAKVESEFNKLILKTSEP